MTTLLLMSFGCIVLIGIVGISAQLVQGHMYRDHVVRYYEGTHVGDYVDTLACKRCTHEVDKKDVIVSFPISLRFINFEHLIVLKTQLVRSY